MSDTATMINRRLVLKLEVSMAFEALILNRLAQLPAARHQDWLRGLLIEGFKSECRTLREIQRGVLTGAQSQRANNAFTESMIDPPPAPAGDATAASKPARHHTEPSAATREITLAALRKVIG